MANGPTTIQQRQQEMHRPFQPLDTTEGRTGRAIEAPQARYAGWANVLADTTGNLTPLINNYYSMEKSIQQNGRGGGRGNEDDNPIAREYYAKAAFDVEETLRTMTPEERAGMDKAAAIRNQTTVEYLKGIKDREIQETLAAQGISNREIFYARENTYDKINLEGAKAIENRNTERNNKFVDELVKNNLDVKNADGSVNYMATLEKGKKIQDSLTAFQTGGQGTLDRNGWTVEMYVMGNAQQKNLMDQAQFDDMKNAMDGLFLPTLSQAIDQLKSGKMTEESLRIQFDALEGDAIRQIDGTFFTNEATRTRLKEYVKSMRGSLNTATGERKATREDLENTLKLVQSDIILSATLDPSSFGDIVRTKTAAGGEVASQMLQMKILNDPNYTISQDGLSKDKTDLASWNQGMRDKYANQYVNGMYIMSGRAPTKGSQEDKRAAQAYVDSVVKDITAKSPEWESMPFEEKNVVRNNWIYKGIAATSSLRGDPNYRDNAMEHYANFIAVLNNPKSLDQLRQNPDMYRPADANSQALYTVDNTAQIAARIIQSSTGPAGVWRTTGEADTRKIYYDEDSGKFMSTAPKWNEGMLIDLDAGTTDSTWNQAVLNLNKVYLALESATSLQLERPLRPDERDAVRDYVINIMKASGMPDNTFVLPSNPKQKGSVLSQGE